MDNMVLAVRSVLTQYATFEGRASRAEFWWAALAFFLISLALRALGAIMMVPFMGMHGMGWHPGHFLTSLFSLLILLPCIALAVRRLHDTGRSGWWLLLSLIPVIGTLVLLYFYIQPSDGPNDWGAPNPLRPD